MKFIKIKNNFISIVSNNDKTINLTTPYLKCPFGLENEYALSNRL